MHEREVKALDFAFKAHAGQVDLGGDPFILHPIRVAMRLETIAERTVALLHDVVEDTPVTVDEIAKEFGGTIARAVDALSRRKTETYEEYILRVKQDPLAVVVKLADLADNMSDHRARNLPPEKQGAWRKRKLDRYERAREVLLG